MKKEKQNVEQSDETIKPMLHEGHSLKSRRDFLAQGLLGMTAFALAPDILSSVARAQSSDCAAPVASGMIPVIVIDLAGGGGLPGSNVMVGGQGGQLDFLDNYSSLGLPSDFHPSRPGMINNELGLVYHSDSGILRGIQSVTSMQTRSNCDGAYFCASLADDTSNNQINPMYWLNKAGAQGSLAQLVGTNNTPSGGNSVAPDESINPTVAPVRIQSANDAINLVSLGGRLNNYSATKRESILNSTTRLSEQKLDTIPRRSLPDAIRKLVSCGFSQTIDQVKSFSPEAVNPANDAAATEVFNRITNATIRNRSIALTKLVLDGMIGAGTITLGGYDYHDGTRARGELLDFELGQLMGAIVELAARKQKDVVIYVITDGGVSPNDVIDNTAGGRGKYNWVGDSGQRSGSLMMVYKRDGRPNLRRRDHRQIGHFRANGANENLALLTSNSAINLTKAMVANYLALHGMEGRLASVVVDDPFRNNLDRYLVFDRIR